MKKRPSQQETAPYSLLDLSVLLQPTRLNRDLTHWAEPLTWRAVIQKSRQIWRECRELLRLTPLTFQEHLAKSLEDLPLAESQRCQFLELCKAAPQDPFFWDAIQETERVMSSLSPEEKWETERQIWSGEFFFQSFSQGQKKFPPEWIPGARGVLLVLDVIRQQTKFRINARSRLFEIPLNQGKPQALLAAIQEELPARWVAEAVAQVERQVSEGNTPEIRRRARALLKKIDKARNAVGKGNVEILPTEEKIKSKRLSVSGSRALHRLLDKHKLQTPYGDSEQTAKAIAADFQEDGRIQDRRRREKIAMKFLERVKQQENLR